jgi:hypothetical protein
MDVVEERIVMKRRTVHRPRELHAVSKLSAFFGFIHQDPVLSQVKLIAELRDVGEGGLSRQLPCALGRVETVKEGGKDSIDCRIKTRLK